MRAFEHMLGIAGRVLVWAAGALLLEELTLAGLARLIVRRVSEVGVARAESGEGLTGHAVPQLDRTDLKENVHAGR